MDLNISSTRTPILSTRQSDIVQEPRRTRALEWNVVAMPLGRGEKSSGCRNTGAARRH